MPAIFEAIKLAFDHPILAGPLILIIIGLAVRPCATYLWNRGRRGWRRLWLPVAIAYLLGMLVVAGYGLWCYRFWGLPPPFAPNEIGFLIAEVPGDAESQRQNAYAQALRELLAKDPPLKDIVKVRLIERPLPSDPERQHREALRIGHWLHAGFILRPYTIEGYQEPWLTVVEQPEFSRTEAPIGKFQNSELAKIDELSLPSDLALLARCVLALAFYRQNAFDSAARGLRDVLAALHPGHRRSPGVGFVPRRPQRAPAQANNIMDSGTS